MLRTLHHRVDSPSKASKITQHVSPLCPFGYRVSSSSNHPHADYPRTLRTWDRRLKSNLKQEVMTKTHPALRDRAEYEVFLRKWEYLFAYAGAGFEKGYITCHMLTFVREVREQMVLLRDSFGLTRLQCRMTPPTTVRDL